MTDEREEDHFKKQDSQLSESSISCPNLNERSVLECPNPNFLFRFRSNCNIGEHPGRPCRIIDSESFQSNDERSSVNNSHPGSLKKLVAFVRKEGSESAKKSKGKGKIKSATKDRNKNNNNNSSKKILRRIAKL